MTRQDQTLDDAAAQPGRRDLLTGFLGATGGLLAASAMSGTAAAQAPVLTDFDILNFALNLEYLEAEFYARAVTGQGLNASERSGVGLLGGVNGGRQVNFTNGVVGAFANELLFNERSHVNFIRSQLGARAIAAPAIDFTRSFDALAQSAGIAPSFDPFASENNFLLAAFTFEEVGVTAYKGAAALLTSPAVIEAAAGILAVEAYQGGVLRSLLVQRGLGDQANAIAALRNRLANGGDEPLIYFGGGVNVVPADENAIAFGRTPAQVLNIAYEGGIANGFGFFPQRTNGRIR